MAFCMILESFLSTTNHIFQTIQKMWIPVCISSKNHVFSTPGVVQKPTCCAFWYLSGFFMIFGTNMLSNGELLKGVQIVYFSSWSPPGVPKGPSTQIWTTFVIDFGAYWCRSGRCLNSGRPALRSSNETVNQLKLDTTKAYEFKFWWELHSSASSVI